MNKLWKLRTLKNLTQKQLAKLSNVSIGTIQNIEQEKSKGNDETWEKLNKVLIIKK